METPPGADVAARLLEAAGGEQEAAAEEEAARRAGHQPEEEAARRAGHQPEPAEDAAAAAPSGGPCPAAAAPSARARRGCSAKAAPAAARASRRKKGSTAAPGPRPRPRRAPRPVTVDSSKARTSLEALKLSLRQLRWKEFPFGRRLPCDIYWHAVSFHDNAIYSGQVNKFPGMTEMVRKITLSRAMRTMQELFPEEYNFYPRSWILPEELAIFFAEVHMIRDTRPSWRPTFIVKPDGGCQGDGIYLIKDPGDIRMTGTLQTRPAVVQEYMSKPLLIDKLKFDIRLYVLLKSLDPLEIYIAKDGLCRFCTEPYQEPTLKNLHRVFMHLTNYSLNVHSGNFVHSDSVNTGSKQTFSSILDRLSAKGVDVRKVWSDIISLVIKTVIAMVPDLKVYYQSDIPTGKPGPSCFQILGFDILLMKNLKPILLEVNANPSMKIEHEKEVSPGVIEYIPSPVDEEVKVAVIRDTLRLVDPHKKKKEEKLNSKISNSGFSMAAADILYIDITRRGSGSLSMDQRDTGMGLQAFVEAVCFLAQRRYKSLSLHEQVELLVDFCEFNLAAWDERRLSCSRAVPERRMALVTCQQDGLHLSPATPTPPQFHSTTAHKLVNYRSPRP
ncbi:tubulin polyglutamylase TTLL11 isoform X2 [Rhineura floridana]|uniref:tubulin polyglutamylase TTLL11 isoform X2 n=1 Tax=Rhineura floridana TaxID=261503 RepID=UPI002AC7F400|nr:tubulin polyglutamylase TTLL11 isoform X2 [Rhineura floridana]